MTLKVLTSEADLGKGVSSFYNRVAMIFIITIILLMSKLRSFEVILDD